MKYFKQDKERLVCLLCQHHCKLKSGQTGLCGINKNTGDQIECLTYGYPCALNIDPIEKKPLYHFIPNTKSFSLGTIGCNFKCPFCQNWQISQDVDLSNEEEHIKIDKEQYFSPKHIVELALHHNCESISYTYTEPTIFYPYAKDIAIEAKKAGLKNVFVSNGYESSEVANDMIGLIDAINIDLKSFNSEYYKKELQGDLNKILETLKFFKKNDIWLEITTLIVPSKNDSIEELTKIASFIANELGTDTPWHISAFSPQYKEQNLQRTPLESLQKAYSIGEEVGLEYIYIGNTGYENSTICKNCGTKLIKRTHFNANVQNLENGKCKNCNTSLEGVF